MSASISSHTVPTIDLSEIRAFCSVSGTDDDALLTMLYNAACQEVVSYAHYIAGSATITVDQEWVSSYELPYWPIGAITSVTVYDKDGVSTVDTDYTFINGILSPSESGVRMVIVYSAGEATLPADMKHAIYQRIKFGYDYGDDLPYDKPRFFDRIVTRYRRNFA